jgi:hypothetical protein
VSDWLTIYVIFEVLAGAAVIGLVVWGYFFWDRRYRGAPVEPGEPGGPDRFRPTPEIFRDDSTGRMVQVFFDPVTGERQYREQGTG